MAAADDVAPDEVRALLAVPLDEFVAARTARVKELKAEGRKDEAAAVAALRKPVRLVWIVGELARRHPDVAATAAEVAEDLETAQAGGSGVRPLLKRFRDVVGQVAELADEIEGAVDRLEVGLALREVLADGEAREEWIDGRLLGLPGDDEEDGPADELAPRRAKKAAATKAAATEAERKKTAGKKAAGKKKRVTTGDADTEAEAEAEAERRAAEEAAAEARRVAEEAVAATEAEVAEASSVREAAAEALAGLEEQLAELETRVGEARESVERADGDLAAAEERHATARAALEDLAGPVPARRRR